MDTCVLKKYYKINYYGGEFMWKTIQIKTIERKLKEVKKLSLNNPKDSFLKLLTNNFISKLKELKNEL